MNNFNNNRNNNLLLIIGIFLIGLFVVTGSYAYWMWSSSDNKYVLFNTSKELSEYIIYDEGESKFVGDFQVGESYLDGVHTTISIYKTEDAKNVDLYATINMDINDIGENISSSKAVKWTLTKGNSEEVGEILSSGNFLGATSGETFSLKSNIEVTTQLQEYTVWLWIDESENPSEELTGETLDTLIWTQVDQITSNRFEITRLNSRGGTINATVVNSLYSVTEYAVTTSSEEPTEWRNIPENEQSNNYLLEYPATELGNYYVWFKDSEGKIVSNQIEVTSLETTPPTGSLLITGESSSLTAVLTASDTESGIKELYGWKVTTSDVCDSTITDFTETTESTYSFSIESGSMYYLCSRFEDNAGNYGYTSMLIPNSTIDYSYTGDYQIYTVPVDGYYQIETYGAQGGSGISSIGGLGSKNEGTIYLEKDETLYVYVGGTTSSSTGGYNGGGNGGDGISTYTNYQAYGGGGATDVRYFGSTIPSESDLLWNSTLGLNSRIMVSAGGSGSIAWNSYGGVSGGTIIGVSSTSTSSCSGGTSTTIAGGTQTSGTAFGQGGAGVQVTTAANCGAEGRGGGSSGYYGGYAQTSTGINTNAVGASGSSFISGYSGVNAITSSSDRTHTNNTLHYSNKYFIDGEMQGGVNSGDGKAKITYLGSDSPERINPKLDNVRYIKDCTNGNSVNGDNHWIELQAIYNGQNITKGKTITTTSTVATNYGSGTTSTIIDGIMDNSSYSGFTSGTQCITIDLGITYNLDEIAVWHYYIGGRTYYDNITYTSSDGNTWRYAITKYEAETANGKRVSAYEEDTTDEDAPTGTLSTTVSGSSITATFSNASDNGGTGIGKYQYLIQTSSNCPTSGYTESTNSSYTFKVSSAGTYYVCGRIKDNVGNISSIHSKSVSVSSVAVSLNVVSGTIPTTSGWTIASDGITATKSVTYNSTYGTLPTPTRSGYTFNGWYNTTEALTFSLAAGTNNYSYKRVVEKIYPGVTYTVTMSSATLTAGTATQFRTLLYDFTDGKALASATTNFGSNVSYSITCPSTADSTHEIALIIYSGINGSTSGNSTTYTNVKVGTTGTTTATKYTSTSTVSTASNHTLYAQWTDNIVPTGTLSVSRSGTTITAKFSSIVENGSGVKEYQYLIQTSSSCPTSGYTASSNSSYSFTKSATGTYYVCARIVDNAGNNSGAYSGSAIIPPSATSYTSAGGYTYTVPVTGNYQLEVWGAQGGTSLVNGSYSTAGGYGGYSVGVVPLSAGTKLYVYVGGKGADGVQSGTASGGYNGGGSGTSDGSDDEAAGGGGGATHIATANGLLSSLSSNKNSVLIVAGGGGGASWTYAPGHGGGIYGGYSSSTTSSSYPTQSSGYAFGQGQNGSGVADSDGVAGGGGGYYGGYSNNVAAKSSGTGGSGYIGNSSLTNKAMYCYNCTTSSAASTLTYLTANVSSTPTSYYAKSGSGAAKISYVEGTVSRPQGAQTGVSGSLSSYYQYNAYYESTYGGMYIRPHYVEQYYEDGNYSIIKIDYIEYTSSMYSQAVGWDISGTISIAGTSYSYSGSVTTSNYTSTKWPCSIVSGPIYHNSDGTKTIDISLTYAWTASGQVGARWENSGTLSSKSVTLTKIS